MRILLLNPNTTEAMTRRLAEAGRQVAGPDTELVPLTAPRGVPYIATRAEAQIGGAVALEMLAEHHRGADAAIIAAFGDPGLAGARELFDIPIVGMAEAAMHAAAQLGRRFAIVTFARALGPWYEDCVALAGMGERCCGILMLDEAIRSVPDVQEEKQDLLVALANRAVVEREADVVILGGAPLAGLAAKVAGRVPVPLVDQVHAAVKTAEMLVALAPRKALAGTYRRPDGKASIGLPAALAARIARSDDA